MQIETDTVRRLRDRLLALAPATSASAGEGAAPTTSSLSPEQQAALERIEPLAEVLFLTIEADGTRARSECDAIRNAIQVLSDDLLPAPAVDRLIRDLEGRLAAQGQEMRVEALASRFALNKPDAEAAFTLAAAIALSDDHLDSAEQALIEQMRSYFGISKARAVALLDGAPTAR